MSTCYIRIDLDNDAFAGDDCGPEVARILNELARFIKNVSRSDLEGHQPTPRDSNGNYCGTCDFEIDEEDPDSEAREQRELIASKFVKQLSRDQLAKLISTISPVGPSDTLQYLRQDFIDYVVEEKLTIEDAEVILWGE